MGVYYGEPKACELLMKFTYTFIYIYGINTKFSFVDAHV